MLIYDPRKGDKIAQRLSLQGHPSEKTDFFIEPKTNEVYGFIRFARTEGEREVSRVLTNAATTFLQSSSTISSRSGAPPGNSAQ